MTRARLHLLILFFFFLLSICSTSSSASTFTVNPSKVKQISWNPRAFMYEGLLTDAECDHLISIAKSELKRSAVADNLSGQSNLNEVRTSFGMFIPKAKDPVVAGIEEKLGNKGLIRELFNGFSTVMDNDKGVITLESLRRNSALLFAEL
ncbi:hypothetical protein ACFX14_040020 [Malus domestica]